MLGIMQENKLLRLITGKSQGPNDNSELKTNKNTATIKEVLNNYEITRKTERQDPENYSLVESENNEDVENEQIFSKTENTEIEQELGKVSVTFVSK